MEPANGFLVRYLRRKLLESDSDINANRVELLRVLDWVPKLWYHLHTFLEKHSTSDFLIGEWGGSQQGRGGDRPWSSPGTGSAAPPAGSFSATGLPTGRGSLQERAELNALPLLGNDQLPLAAY